MDIYWSIKELPKHKQKTIKSLSQAPGKRSNADPGTRCENSCVDYIFSQMKMETIEDALGKTGFHDGSRLFGF